MSRYAGFYALSFKVLTRQEAQRDNWDVAYDVHNRFKAEDRMGVPRVVPRTRLTPEGHPVSNRQEVIGLDERAYLRPIMAVCKALPNDRRVFAMLVFDPSEPKVRYCIEQYVGMKGAAADSSFSIHDHRSTDEDYFITLDDAIEAFYRGYVETRFRDPLSAMYPVHRDSVRVIKPAFQQYEDQGAGLFS